MKWTISLLIILTGCTITVKPIPQASKHTVTGTHHLTARRTYSSSNIRDSSWVEKYKKLESDHGDYTIRSDNEIEELPDGRFKVPNASVTHYQDLILVKPSPSPTPTY